MLGLHGGGAGKGAFCSVWGENPVAMLKIIEDIRMPLKITLFVGYVSDITVSHFC